MYPFDLYPQETLVPPNLLGISDNSTGMPGCSPTPNYSLPSWIAPRCDLSLTLSCTGYEWLEPLIAGDVEPDGINLTVLTDLRGGERHWRTVKGEFDVADVWGRSFEFDANADELWTMIRYAHEQGLIDKRFHPTEMFVRADESLL